MAPAVSGSSQVTGASPVPPRVPSQVPDSDDDPDPMEFPDQAGDFQLPALPEAPELSRINGNIPASGELELIAEPQKVTGMDWEHWE